RTRRIRQTNGSGAGLHAAREDVGMPPAAPSLGGESARCSGHLTEQLRRGARVVQQIEARVRMEAAHDLVVMELHHGVPAIDHLCELRESKAVEADAGDQTLTAVGGA